MLDQIFHRLQKYRGRWKHCAGAALFNLYTKVCIGVNMISCSNLESYEEAHLLDNHTFHFLMVWCGIFRQLREMRRKVQLGLSQYSYRYLLWDFFYRAGLMIDQWKVLTGHIVFDRSQTSWSSLSLFWSCATQLYQNQKSKSTSSWVNLWSHLQHLKHLWI